MMYCRTIKLLDIKLTYLVFSFHDFDIDFGIPRSSPTNCIVRILGLDGEHSFEQKKEGREEGKKKRNVLGLQRRKVH
jgi:hypothetical protein